MSELPPQVTRLISDATGFLEGMTRAKGATAQWQASLIDADLASRKMGVTAEAAALRASTAAKRAADATTGLAKAQLAAASAAERLAAGTATQEEATVAATKAEQAETVVLEAQTRAAIAAERAAIASAEAQLAASRQIVGAGTAQEAAATRVGSSWSRTGGVLAKVGTIGSLALTGVAIESLKMASEFDRQMEMVHTQAGASQHEVDSLKNSVLGLAGATGQGPVKLAEALYHVESVGYRGADALAILKMSAQEASISGANLDATTYALTSTMKTFGDTGVKGATKDIGLLNAIVGQGDMRFQDLNMAIQTGILSTGQTFGVSLQSMGAGLEYLTDRGEKADVASTRLAMGITLMGAPSRQATKYLKDMGLAGADVTTAQTAMQKALHASGLTTTKLADDLRKPDGIYVALKDLTTQMERGGLTAGETAATIAKVFGGARTGKAIMALVENLDGVQQKFDATGKQAGQFGENFAATTRTLSFKWHAFVANLEAAGIKLGHMLEPFAAGAISGFEMAGRAAAGAVKYLNQHRDAVAAVALAYAALKWQSIAAGVTTVIGSFETLALKGMYAFDALKTFGGLGPIFGAAALVTIGLMATGFTNIQTHAKEALPAVKNLTDAIATNDNAGQIKSFLDALQGSSSGNKGQSALQFLEKYKVNLSALFSAVKSGDAAKIGDVLSKAFAGNTDASSKGVLNMGYLLAGLGTNFKLAADGAVALNAGQATLANTTAAKATPAQQAYKKAQDELNAALKAGNPLAAQFAAQSVAIAKAQDTASQSAGILTGAQGDLGVALSDVAKTLASQVGFFTGVSNASTVTKDTLIKNARDTIDALNNEAGNVAKLSSAGLSGGVIKGLVGQGPQVVAAAAAMSLAELQNYGTQSVLATQANQRAQLAIVKATQPEIYQAMVEVAKTHQGDVDVANHAVFVGTFQKVAQQAIGMAQTVGSALPDNVISRLLAGRDKVVAGLASTFTGPQQDAVRALESLATSGGAAMATNLASAIASGTPLVVSKQEALKDGLNAQTMQILKDIGITVSVSDQASGSLLQIRTEVQQLIDMAPAAATGAMIANATAGGRGGVGKAAGGFISGPGTGTSDSIPLMGSNGEFMVNAKQTAKNRPVLEAINSGADFPRFAQGGPVGFAAGGHVTHPRLNAAEKRYLAALNFSQHTTPSTASFLNTMAHYSGLASKQDTINAYTADRYAKGLTTAADVPRMQAAAQTATGDYQQALKYFSAHQDELVDTFTSKTATAAQRSSARSVYDQLQSNVSRLRDDASAETLLAQTMRGQYRGAEAVVNTPGRATRDWSYLAVAHGAAASAPMTAHVTVVSQLDGRAIASSTQKVFLQSSTASGKNVLVPQTGLRGH
jgi:hypothetical protein